MKKAQMSIEFLISVALVFSVLLVIVAINLDMLSAGSERMRLTKARHAVDEIAKQAELIYQEGAGAMTKVYINMPEAVDATLIRNKTLIINVSASGGIREISRRVDFNITGTIPDEAGSYWVEVISYGSFVNVSNINTTG